MTEAEKPTLEEALAAYATNPYWGPEAGTPEKPRRNWLAFDVIRDAARRFSDIEKAVKAGTLKITKIERPLNALGFPIPRTMADLGICSTDPLIDGESKP